jgi:hypothetical protein
VRADHQPQQARLGRELPRGAVHHKPRVGHPAQAGAAVVVNVNPEQVTEDHGGLRRQTEI